MVDLNLIPRLPHILVAGCLKFFKSQWLDLTSDPEILDMIQGMHIDTVFTPAQDTFPHELQFGQDETEAVNNQIMALLQKKAIIPCDPPTPGEYVSTVFTRPKKDGGHRMILNLKKFNKAIARKKFKMEMLKHILSLVTPHCYMTSIDLSDAYLVVPICGLHIRFLKFQWKGQTYCYVCLPFGYKYAPRKFTKLLKPLLAALPRQGVIIVVYIDDSWIKADTYEECKASTKSTAELFLKLGFIINQKKSVFIPSQRITILGFIIDSVDMSVTLSPSKVEPIVKMCTDLVSHPVTTVCHMCQVIGKLMSCMPAVPLGMLNYRHLERCKLWHWRRYGYDWDAPCNLDYKCIRNLQWWIEHLPNSSGPITRATPVLAMETDACDYGWGGVV